MKTEHVDFIITLLRIAQEILPFSENCKPFIIFENDKLLLSVVLDIEDKKNQLYQITLADLNWLDIRGEIEEAKKQILALAKSKADANNRPHGA